ncbi:glycerol-3-phosphate 1-O-acyltransferase PlsY [Arsenicitalea aurantiaca]|uniref:Glycerol-3-phosphate acyltransferase n=1 Tax=Arsenicitalea aurantiaca TaxID=1783274 RepID=A0A433XFS4_9HYPH|nr:glycerol-3-phosphate 1-O-acyltransferase PlsY [Arsenicitalea aurantiaca]RUT32935.1 glycerol-3-phosphate 1-O-acyltransferase PlsY [Arsenicitalea aurantiaca]
MNALDLVLGLGLGYLLGSVPFGLLLTRAAGLGDIRAIGSGNIGATNVLRTGKKWLAALTLLLDAAKGAVPVLLAAWLWGSEAAMAAAVGAFLGHVFPVWLRFNGGKGVATLIGVLFGLNWVLGLIFCATWLLVALVGRISSLSALVAAATTPIIAFFLEGPALALTIAVLAAILFYRHAPNIARLRAGTEPRIGGRKAEAP